MYNYEPLNLDINTMGSHHADFYPDGEFIYIGSAEGRVFVISKNTMEIIAMVDAGTGAGRTTYHVPRFYQCSTRWLLLIIMRPT